MLVSSASNMNKSNKSLDKEAHQHNHSERRHAARMRIRHHIDRKDIEEYDNIYSNEDDILIAVYEDVLNLLVTVHRGDGLVAKDRNVVGLWKSSDPYVVLEVWPKGVPTKDDKDADSYSSIKFGRSPTITKTLKPVWDYTFEPFNVPISQMDMDDALLRVHILDDDFGLEEDDSMGFFDVYLQPKKQVHEIAEKWYPISRTSCTRASGRVQVSLTTIHAKESVVVGKKKKEKSSLRVREAIPSFKKKTMDRDESNTDGQDNEMAASMPAQFSMADEDAAAVGIALVAADLSRRRSHVRRTRSNQEGALLRPSRRQSLRLGKEATLVGAQTNPLRCPSTPKPEQGRRRTINRTSSNPEGLLLGTPRGQSRRKIKEGAKDVPDGRNTIPGSDMNLLCPGTPMLKEGKRTLRRASSNPEDVLPRTPRRQSRRSVKDGAEGPQALSSLMCPSTPMLKQGRGTLRRTRSQLSEGTDSSSSQCHSRSDRPASVLRKTSSGRRIPKTPGRRRSSRSIDKKMKDALTASDPMSKSCIISSSRRGEETTEDDRKPISESCRIFSSRRAEATMHDDTKRASNARQSSNRNRYDAALSHGLAW